MASIMVLEEGNAWPKPVNRVTSRVRVCLDDSQGLLRDGSGPPRRRLAS